ncbi:ABC transporter ATP-binding protein [Lapidilactobacillus achengensis]|uniref:ABC transporter ATP-binding protein n=1 Tax=Lapidilactobacillus achengensis TaxID=2486000 RepID=A0ABW1UN02_9LACO|nr:ABC transporter ATP-binding protein [Lapidilactobacillus achengensis]
MSTIIEFKDVSKAYPDQPTILVGLNLKIQQGEIFVLVGPSGSGKTTSLKMINGLIQPTTGTIDFAGRPMASYDLRKLRWQIGYVLQQIALFPTMTVRQNISVIPEMLGWKRARQDREVVRLLKMVDLDPDQYQDRYPRELSGGEQQRIGILRALIAEPEVILMDEPFSALDPISRTSLQDLVLRLHQELQTTIVFVTHDMREALKLADRVGVIHEGELLQVGTPQEIVEHPATAFVGSFFEGETGSEPHDFQVADLITAGKYSVDLFQTDLPVVTPTVPAQTLFGLLTRYEMLQVNDQTGKVLGSLSRQDVFDFLSDRFA